MNGAGKSGRMWCACLLALAMVLTALVGCASSEILRFSASLEALSKAPIDWEVESGSSYRVWDGEQALLLVHRRGELGKSRDIIDIMSLGGQGQLRTIRTTELVPEAGVSQPEKSPLAVLQLELQAARQELFLQKKAATNNAERALLEAKLKLVEEQARLLARFPTPHRTSEIERMVPIGPARGGTELAFIEERFRFDDISAGVSLATSEQIYLIAERTARLHILDDNGARQVIQIPGVGPAAPLGSSYGLSFHSLWSHEDRWFALAFENSRAEDWARPGFHSNSSIVPVIGSIQVANTIGAKRERAFVFDLAQGSRTSVAIDSIMAGCDSLIALSTSSQGIDMTCFDRDWQGPSSSLEASGAREGTGRVLWRRVDPTGSSVIEENSASLDSHWLWGYPKGIRYSEPLGGVVLVGQDEGDKTPCGRRSHSNWVAVMGKQGGWVHEPACIDLERSVELDYAYDGAVIIDGQQPYRGSDYHPVVFVEPTGSSPFWLPSLSAHCRWWPGGAPEARGAWSYPDQNDGAKDPACPVGWVQLTETLY